MGKGISAVEGLLVKMEVVGEGDMSHVLQGDGDPLGVDVAAVGTRASLVRGQVLVDRLDYFRGDLAKFVKLRCLNVLVFGGSLVGMLLDLEGGVLFAGKDSRVPVGRDLGPVVRLEVAMGSCCAHDKFK